MKKQTVIGLCTIAGVALFCGTKAFAADSDYAIYKPHSMLTTAYQEAWNDVNRASTEAGSGDGKSADSGGSSDASSDGGSEGGGESSGGVNLKTAVGDISAGKSSSGGGSSKSKSDAFAASKASDTGIFANNGIGKSLNNFFKGLGKWGKEGAEKDKKQKKNYSYVPSYGYNK